MYNFRMSQIEMIATIKFFRNVAIKTHNRGDFEKYDILLQALHITPIRVFQNDSIVLLLRQGVSHLALLEKPMYIPTGSSPEDALDIISKNLQRAEQQMVREDFYNSLTPNTHDWDEEMKDDAFMASICSHHVPNGESWREMILGDLLG